MTPTINASSISLPSSADANDRTAPITLSNGQRRQKQLHQRQQQNDYQIQRHDAGTRKTPSVIPITIELHNLFLKEPIFFHQDNNSGSNTTSRHIGSTNNSNNNNKWWRYHLHHEFYQSNLLYHAQLEILVQTAVTPTPQPAPPTISTSASGKTSEESELNRSDSGDNIFHNNLTTTHHNPYKADDNDNSNDNISNNDAIEGSKSIDRQQYENNSTLQYTHRVIYREVCSTTTLCPIWRHINEIGLCNHPSLLIENDKNVRNNGKNDDDTATAITSTSPTRVSDDTFSFDNITSEEFNTITARISIVANDCDNTDDEKYLDDDEVTEFNDCDNEHDCNIHNATEALFYSNSNDHEVANANDSLDSSRDFIDTNPSAINNKDYDNEVVISNKNTNARTLIDTKAATRDDVLQQHMGDQLLPIDQQYDRFCQSGAHDNNIKGTTDTSIDEVKLIMNGTTCNDINSNSNSLNRNKSETKTTRLKKKRSANPVLKTHSIVLNVPIHPKKMFKIAFIPEFLPLNCIIVHFSDGSIRVQPSQYELMLLNAEMGAIGPLTSSIPSSLSLKEDLNSTKRSSINSTSTVNGTTTVGVNKISSGNNNKKSSQSLSQQSSLSYNNDLDHHHNNEPHFDDSVFAALDSVAALKQHQRPFSNNVDKSNLDSSPSYSNDMLFPDLLKSDHEIMNSNNKDVGYYVDDRGQHFYYNDTFHPEKRSLSMIKSKGRLEVEVSSLEDSTAVVDVLTTTTLHSSVSLETFHDNTSVHPSLTLKAHEGNKLSCTPIGRVSDGFRDEIDNDNDDKSDSSTSYHNNYNLTINAALEGTAPVGPLQERIERQHSNERKRQLLQDEQFALEQCILHEEEELQRELLSVVNDNPQYMLNRIRYLELTEQRIKNILEQTLREQLECQQYRFDIDAQQVRLINELSTIYPIQVVTTDRRWYIVGGLELPRFDSFFTSSASSSSSNAMMSLGSSSSTGQPLTDDEISAALGNTSKLVFMLGLYLNVPLRYRVICHSSRSAIIDTHAIATSQSSYNSNNATNVSSASAGVIYPLFLCRGIEREQLDYAVHLLSSNVDCICKSRSIRINTNVHILAKIKRIYEHVIDGY